MPDEETVVAETEQEQQPAAETAETEETQPEEVAEGETADAQEEPEQEPEPVVSVKQYNEAQYRLRKANEQIKKLSQPVQAEVAAQPYAFSAPEPKWEQFEQPEEYVRAHHDWATSKLEHKHIVEQHTAALIEREEARAQYGKERLAEGTKKYPDFVEVLDKAGLRSNAYTEMVDSVLDSDNCADLLYHLGNNKAELTRISQLSDKAQVRELGKLEARIVATQTLKEKQKVQPTKVEGAGGGAKPKAEIDPHKEFEKARASGDLRQWAEYIRKTKSVRGA